MSDLPGKKIVARSDPHNYAVCASQILLELGIPFILLMPFGNSDGMSVPEGRVRIAQGFSLGVPISGWRVPKGRLNVLTVAEVSAVPSGLARSNTQTQSGSLGILE